MEFEKTERALSAIGTAGKPDAENPDPGAARQPCTATVVDRNSGARRPCRSWAMRGSDPPRCYAHGVLAGARQGPRPGRGQHLQVGGAHTPAGPAQQPAPLVSEETATSLALYQAFYDEGEAAALVAMGDPASLEGEVATARVIVRRLLAYLTQEKGNETPADVLLRFAEMIFKGTGAVAHLVRDEKGEALASEEAKFAAARKQALDELAEEWGLRDDSFE